MTDSTLPTEQAAGNSAEAPPSPAYRWLVLVVISLAMFGNYYVYDCISPLADVLVAQLGFTDANIGLLQAIYSFPNLVMVLIGGIIIDRIGTRKGTLLFGVLCVVGSVVTAFADHPALLALAGSFGVPAGPDGSGPRLIAVMAGGRLVFGLGAESLIVAVTTAIAKWFKGKELSFAFGVNLTIARLGSFAALNSPSWAAPAYTHWQWPLMISVAFGTMCVVGAMLYWVLEAKAQRRGSVGTAGQTDKVVFRDIFSFSASYWLIVALCVTFYSGIFPFQTFAVKLFMDVHGTSREMGGFLSSLLTLAAMVGTPAFGYLADRAGKRSLMMVAGALLLLPVYLIIGYVHVSLYVPMAMMGIAFSVIPAVMWPSVAYVVPEAKLGTAYGLMTLVQNAGLTGFNLLIGWVNDRSDASAANPAGYLPGLWTFSCLGLFALMFALMLRKREQGPQAHGLETITTH